MQEEEQFILTVEAMPDKFDCNTPLQAVYSFEPYEYYLNFEDKDGYDGQFWLDKSNEIKIYNRWKGDKILITIDLPKGLKAYYTTISDLNKVTLDPVVEFFKNNEIALKNNCPGLTDDQFNMIEN
ncbi:hypothetical protein [Robiginitalea aurantiaca]|uniref:Uncharacterized protein n=1 Tax=Robiginitalea aurantiaca TaxID=3056915 RepID=A0ABT7WFB1_9FLAO|nr:hypothetical protein [Robiginitalea aurantiaca]MDM9631605.1 hypothetical protein [Robiginitalea aurantiaca]